MSQATQMKLAGSRSGRIILHSIALIKDRKFRWHFAGIKRDLLGR